MTIPGLAASGKTLVSRMPADVLLVLILLLSVSAAFGLGVLAGKDMAQKSAGEGFWIEELPAKPLTNGGGPAAAVSAPKVDIKPEIPAATSGAYMASKNGTKYYLPTCSSANRIKAENRVWFASREEAEAAGYAPAANCPGL